MLIALPDLLPDDMRVPTVPHFCWCFRPNPTKTCFAIADWWLYGPVCMICAGISSKLFLELSRVQDRINMSKEISSAAIAWLVTSGGCTIPL